MEFSTSDRDTFSWSQFASVAQSPCCFADWQSAGGRTTEPLRICQSAPVFAKWLGHIRGCFKEDVVAAIQNDAIEKKGPIGVSATASPGQFAVLGAKGEMTEYRVPP